MTTTIPDTAAARPPDLVTRQFKAVGPDQRWGGSYLKRTSRPTAPADAKMFALHWGSGFVEEEAQFETKYHRPTIQLLNFTDGDAKGTYGIRFCHYDQKGRFQRSPLIIDAGDLPKLVDALGETPKLRKMLARALKG